MKETCKRLIEYTAVSITVVLVLWGYSLRTASADRIASTRTFQDCVFHDETDPKTGKYSPREYDGIRVLLFTNPRTGYFKAEFIDDDDKNMDTRQRPAGVIINPDDGTVGYTLLGKYSISYLIMDYQNKICAYYKNLDEKNRKIGKIDLMDY